MRCTGKQKTCSACKQKLELSEFWRNKTQPDGYQAQCKNCLRKCAGRIAAHERYGPEIALRKHLVRTNTHWFYEVNGRRADRPRMSRGALKRRKLTVEVVRYLSGLEHSRLRLFNQCGDIRCVRPEHFQVANPRTPMIRRDPANDRRRMRDVMRSIKVRPCKRCGMMVEDLFRPKHRGICGVCQAEIAVTVR